jgi:hypothetical protein
MSDLADEPRALFVPDGDSYVPTGFARGPWSPHSLHGGPVAALVVRELEAVEAPRPARLTRVTVELMRPVPLAPLVVHTQVLRPGAKVATLDATVTTLEGDVLAMARAQRIRTAQVDFPDGITDSVPDLPDEPSDPSAWAGSRLAFHSHATEHRYVVGAFGAVGPCTDWIRLRVPVVAGEEPTGWQRAAATADFSNGISAVAPFDGSSLFINPDLTVQLWREPEGEWICSEAVTRTSGSGIGMAETALWDRSGRVGRGTQSLLLDRT